MDERFKNSGRALGHFIEECGECLHAAGKVVRYGWHFYNPLATQEHHVYNDEYLRLEVADLEHAIRRLKKSRGWV